MVSLIKVSEDIYLVDGYPYIYISSINALVSADYHFGYEVVLAEEEGYFLPQTQFDTIVGEVDSMLRDLDIEVFIINGDLKHKFSRRTRQETKEVKLFTKHISERVNRVYIIRGNHDNFVRGIFNEFGNVDFIEPYLVLNDFVFTHGHIYDEKIIEVSRGKRVFIGHEHPALLLYDDVGGKVKIPVLVQSRLDFGAEIFVLPAVSPLMTGTEINLIPKEELLSPLFKLHGDLDNAKIYGISRGKYTLEFPRVKDIREVLNIA